MHKALLYFFFAVFLSIRSFAQVVPSDKEIMDSLLQHDEFLKMLAEMGDAESYFRLNVGVGDRLFSGNNKAVQSVGTENQLVLTPSVAYFHKSGFSLSFAGYLLNKKNTFNFYQYAISPAYSYSKSGVAEALVSYIHYFKESSYDASSFPFNDEIYASFVFKKPFIKPGISVNYSSGKYKEIIHIDTTVILNRPTLIKYVDTATTRISSFSLSPYIEHDFTFYTIFSKKDALRFTPQVSLTAAINNYSVSHKSSSQLFMLYTKKHLKKLRRFQSFSGSEKGNGNFEIQSVGLDLDLNYSIGKFYIEPEIYLDYYLPKTDDKVFTRLYNFNIGITF